MAAPRFDSRNQADVYSEALALARKLAPEWAAGFGEGDSYFNRDDPGLVMLQLFGELHGDMAAPLNAVSDKYRLAFWDFLGLALRAPKPAEAPIAVFPSGNTPVTLAAGTQIVSATDKTVVFETAADLPLLPARIAAAMSVLPDADTVADYGGRVYGQGAAFPLFGADPAMQPIVHALYLGDAGFDFGSATGTLTVTLEGVNLDTRYFSAWTDASGTPLQTSVSVDSYNQLTIRFARTPAIPAQTVNGIDMPWLRVAPDPGVRILSIDEETLPDIYSITATVALDSVAADNAFFNATSVDLKKGGRPFGKQPAVEDAFYLASRTAFSKPGASVDLDLDLESISPPESVALQWEYWNGNWRPLQVADGTANLTRSGRVSFTAPRIEETRINNVSNYWIRVRIVSGGYGTPQGRLVTLSAADVVNGVLGPYVSDPDEAIAALDADNIDFGYIFKPASFTPPFINALSLSCLQTRAPQYQLSQNGTRTGPLRGQPYLPAPETEPTFYLGFAPDGFEDAVLGQMLTLYLAFSDEDPSLLPTAEQGHDNRGLAIDFDYFDGRGWRPLRVARPPGDFHAEGILALNIPDTMATSTLFAQTLYWMRLRGPRAGAARLTPVGGIYPNTVPAFNAVSWTNVVLGSSTGAPAQSFAFPHSPVLDKPCIQVLEAVPGPASAAGHGDIDRHWVTWMEVSNFDFATPYSRCYVIDHQAGTLFFGDGVRGMVPPRGNRNVRAAAYSSGGGTAGNRPLGDLNALKKSNAAVASLRNVEPAVGGVNVDHREDLALRAPGQVRARDRAVTLDDFIALAVASSQQVVRAAGSGPELGRLSIVVLPRYDGPVPEPNYDLLGKVHDYLAARALPLTAAALHVTGPDYAAVTVSVRAILQPGANHDQVEQAMTETYEAYVNPLTGGPAHTGWAFGGTLRAANLADRLAGVAGVAMIDGVVLQNDLSFVQFAWNQLPASGGLTLEAIDADAV